MSARAIYQISEQLIKANTLLAQQRLGRRIQQLSSASKHQSNHLFSLGQLIRQDIISTPVSYRAAHKVAQSHLHQIRRSPLLNATQKNTLLKVVNGSFADMVTGRKLTSGLVQQNLADIGVTAEQLKTYPIQLSSEAKGHLVEKLQQQMTSLRLSNYHFAKQLPNLLISEAERITGLKLPQLVNL
jgi:hypothetical protein